MFTVPRYAGGKAQIRDAVVARSAARIVESVQGGGTGDDAEREMVQRFVAPAFTVD